MLSLKSFLIFINDNLHLEQYAITIPWKFIIKMHQEKLLCEDLWGLINGSHLNIDMG